MDRSFCMARMVDAQKKSLTLRSTAWMARKERGRRLVLHHGQAASHSSGLSRCGNYWLNWAAIGKQVDHLIYARGRNMVQQRHVLSEHDLEGHTRIIHTTRRISKRTKHRRAMKDGVTDPPLFAGMALCQTNCPQQTRDRHLQGPFEVVDRLSRIAGFKVTLLYYRYSRDITQALAQPET